MTQYSIKQLTPEYLKLWSGLQLTKRPEAERAAKTILKGKAEYQKVQALTGVPWFVVGLTHYRESNCNFGTWLHNGDKMRVNGKPVQTHNVPAHRPPDPSVDWVTGAVDALVDCEHLDGIKAWGPEHVAYASEKFNGFGYRNPNINIPSPYLWGGTNRQVKGKFVKDHVFSRSVMDPQLGTMAVLKALMEVDPEASFGDAPEAPTEAPEDAPRSPKAQDPDADQIKPLSRSKTLWGGLWQWLAGVGGSLVGMWEYIATPWGFACLALILTVLTIGFVLVIKGRIDVQKLVEHLSPAPADDAGWDTSA